jgi:transposase
VVIQFLRRLLRLLPGKLLIIWDNVSTHHSQDMQDVLVLPEIQARLQTLYLPSYAPELNPIELVWRYLKYVLLKNRVVRTLHELKIALRRAIRRLRRQPHLLRQFVRHAKIMTLFHPQSGQVRVKGTASTTNLILHPWLKHELEMILAQLPKKEALADPVENRAEWLPWQVGLHTKITLPQELPRLRMLLILDNLSGHKSVDLVLWLFAHGIMPLYTPLGGSWLNMTESVQRILKKRALEGSYPRTQAQIMAWFETVARHWNADPTPFIWGGKRQTRRQRARQRRLHRLGGSGAYTRRPVRRKWQVA